MQLAQQQHALLGDTCFSKRTSQEREEKARPLQVEEEEEEEEKVEEEEEEKKKEAMKKGKTR